MLNSADARYSNGDFTFDVNLPLFDNIHERSGWVASVQSFFSTPDASGVFVGNTHTNVFANIHIAEFAQMTSYSSKTKHFSTMVATFTDRSLVNDISANTIGTPIDEHWWINKVVTISFTDNTLTRITTPSTARFQIVLNLWKADD